MRKDSPRTLVNTFIKKIDVLLAKNYPNIKIPENNFITWYMPGIPFEEQDFEFCKIGLRGYAHKEKGPDGTEVDIDASSHSRSLFSQAYFVSNIFEFIPEFPKEDADFNEFRSTSQISQVLFEESHDTISSVYKDILDHSIVYDEELDDEVKNKIEEYRSKLFTTKEDPPGTGHFIAAPTPMYQAYDQKMNEYLQSAEEYNSVLWSMKAGAETGELKSKLENLKIKMDACYSSWVSLGYKNDVEIIFAFIDQNTRRSRLLYKQDLIMKFERGKFVSDDMTSFYFTTVRPSTFFTMDWPSLTINENDYDAYYSSHIDSQALDNRILLDLFSRNTLNPDSEVHINNTQKFTGLNMTLEFMLVALERPWFQPAFFSVKEWKLDKNWELKFGKDNKVSDGKPCPMGRLIAYPTIALFVRNVILSFDEVDDMYEYLDEKSKADGTIGLGPFVLGGSYHRWGVKRKLPYSVEEGKIKIANTQLIAAINKLVPKSPDPNPDLNPDGFVGGLI